MAEYYDEMGSIELTFDVVRTFQEIREVFSAEHEEFDEEDAIEVLNNPPDPVHFPIFIFVLSVVKDIMDMLDLTLIGIIVTTLFSIFASITIFFWMFGKVKGKWWKKKILRFLIRRAIIMICAEVLPFIKMIPTTTIFVLMAHYKEKKIVRLMNIALEMMRKGGITRRVNASLRMVP